jgi:peptidyl-prolyl cis-trans isomerase SurA
MPLNKIQMKFINSRIHIFPFTVFKYYHHSARNYRDTVVAPVKKVKKQRQKIDGIIATVGDFIILDSDIDKSYGIV